MSETLNNQIQRTFYDSEKAYYYLKEIAGDVKHISSKDHGRMYWNGGISIALRIIDHYIDNNGKKYTIEFNRGLDGFPSSWTVCDSLYT